MDIVISNCVLNLVTDKKKAFREIFRILKAGGRFYILDIVIQGRLPLSLQKLAEMYAEGVSDTMQLNHYLETIRQAGFIKIEIKKKKIINLPDTMRPKFLNPEELDQMQKDNIGIFSIRATGFKDSSSTKRD